MSPATSRATCPAAPPRQRPGSSAGTGIVLRGVHVGGYRSQPARCSRTRLRARPPTTAQARLKAALPGSKEEHPEAEAPPALPGSSGLARDGRHDTDRAGLGPPTAVSKATSKARACLGTNQSQHFIPIPLQTGSPDTGTGTARYSIAEHLFFCRFRKHV